MSVLERREPGSSGTGRPLSLPPPHHTTLYALFCGSGGNPRRGAAPVTHGLRAATTLQPVSRPALSLLTHLISYHTLIQHRTGSAAADTRTRTLHLSHSFSPPVILTSSGSVDAAAAAGLHSFFHEVVDHPRTRT